MRVRISCVFSLIVLNYINVASTQLIDQQSDITKPVPHERLGTLFKQPTIIPSPEEAQRNYGCATLPCDAREEDSVVCACNFNTGNVVSFKDSCDMKKHNCRFYTDFQVILGEICPWEFQSRRRNKQLVIDYNDSKYYN